MKTLKEVPPAKHRPNIKPKKQPKTKIVVKIIEK